MPMPPSETTVHLALGGTLWRLTDPAFDPRPRPLLTHLRRYMGFYTQREQGLQALLASVQDGYARSIAQLLAERISHARKVEGLRSLAELAGMGGRFDNDLVITEGCAQVRYLVSAAGQVPGAVAAVERWQEMTQRQAAWVQTLADRHVAQGQRVHDREKLLRAEIQLRQTAQASELEALSRRMAELQAAVEPALVATQRALPGAAGDRALPEDMQGARWETIADVLEAWELSLRGLMPQVVTTLGGAKAAPDSLKDILAFLQRVCGQAAAGCRTGSACREQVADTVARYHELEGTVRSDPTVAFAALKGPEALATLVDHNGRPTREGDAEVRRAVDDELLLPRNWQAGFGADLDPSFEKLRVLEVAFGRAELTFSQSLEVYGRYRPAVETGKARWCGQIEPLAEQCRVATTEDALLSAIGRLYEAFDTRPGFSMDQRAQVLGDKIGLPEVDRELAPAVAAAGARYSELCALRYALAARELTAATETLAGLTTEQAGTHAWRDRARMEADLAENLEPQVPTLPGRCADWLAATMQTMGQTAALEASAQAKAAYESAKTALDAAYRAAFSR